MLLGAMKICHGTIQELVAQEESDSLDIDTLIQQFYGKVRLK